MKNLQNLYLYTIIFVFTIINFSCKRSQLLNESGELIKIEYKNGEKFEWPQTLEIKEIIKLQTDSNCIIGKIKKVIKTKDNFYILDDRLKTIFSFNKEGKFLFSIHQVGKGPHEYIETNDFCISFDKRVIYILDYKKVLCFDAKDGAYLSSFSIDTSNSSGLNPLQILNPEKDLFIFWNNNPDTRNQKDGRYFYMFTYELGKITKFLPYSNYDVFNERLINSYNKILIGSPNGFFDIFFFENKSIHKYYSFDFGNLNLPSHYYPIRNREMNNKIQKLRFFKQIVNIRENSKFLSILFWGPDDDAYYEVLFNKLSKEVLSGRFQSNSFINIVESDENDFYGLIEPSYLLNKNNSDNVICKLLTNVVTNEMDNPIIVKFRIE